MSTHNMFSWRNKINIDTLQLQKKSPVWGYGNMSERKENSDTAHNIKYHSS